MQTKSLGRTGEAISVIGYGAMALSIEDRAPEAEGVRALHAALDCGITFIDTADVYCLDDEDLGHNERLIAGVLRARPDRDGIRVATKGGMRRPGGAWTRDGSPEHLRRACENSLRMLGVDRIFLYQLHAPDPHVPFEKSVEALAELQREGKCEWVGLSNVAVDHIERASRIMDVVSVQNRLSPYYRESIEEGVVGECERRGITFLAYRPVGGGRLTHKLHEFPRLCTIAALRGLSPHAVALAWVRAQGTTIIPIPGARKAEHVVDSARAADVVLAAEEIAAIDQARWVTALPVL